MRLDQVGGDDAAGNQVFLDDALEHGRIACAVPGAFGIDDRNRAALADAQAVGLGAQDAALVRQAELLQPPLQKVPRRQAAFLLAALRGRLVAAEKDVPPRDGDADRGGDLSLRFESSAPTVHSVTGMQTLRTLVDFGVLAYCNVSTPAAIAT